MIHNIDLFTHPETLGDVKSTVEILHEQIKIVEGLEHAKDRLATTRSLESNTLSKCNVFVRYVNETSRHNNFYLEVSKLSLDELAFSSISFEERRLKTLLDSFKASDIRDYMKTQNVSCLDRSEIFTRLTNILAQCKGSQFDEIYTALVDQPTQSVTESDMQMNKGTVKARYKSNHAIPLLIPPAVAPSEVLPDPEPSTGAEAADAFEFPGALWENIETVFGEHIANAVRSFPQQLTHREMTDCVKSKYPRVKGVGDAIISLDLGSDGNFVSSLFQGHETIAQVAKIAEVFGDRIANAIEESDLRKWEKRNGYTDTTSCVKLAYHVKLRICYDTVIANILHSDNAISPPVYSC